MTCPAIFSFPSLRALFLAGSLFSLFLFQGCSEKTASRIPVVSLPPSSGFRIVQPLPPAPAGNQDSSSKNRNTLVFFFPSPVRIRGMSLPSEPSPSSGGSMRRPESGKKFVPRSNPNSIGFFFRIPGMDGLQGTREPFFFLRMQGCPGPWSQRRCMTDSWRILIFRIPCMVSSSGNGEPF